ncbi:MAG: hypothetical protein QOJ03_225 [Frankiaceae bacterium]|nr:hypothetical protein [Frankiaceae bacterium]
MKRIIAAVIGFMLSAAVVPASADSHVKTVTFMLVRTTSGASQFDLSLSAHDSSKGAFVGDIDAVIRHGRVVETVAGSMGGLQSEADGVEVGPLHVRTCALTRCGGDLEGQVGTAIGYSSDNSEGDVNAIFVVLHGSGIVYHFRGVGWRVLPMRLDYRTVDTRAASPVRVSSGVYSAAAIDGASAPGGAVGSVALAAPPCSIATVGVVSRGVGQIRLTGGATSPTFTCPTDRVPIGSYTNRKATWSVDGWAAGDSTLSDTTLFVIDRPARLPHAAP